MALTRTQTWSLNSQLSTRQASTLKASQDRGHRRETETGSNARAETVNVRLELATIPTELSTGCARVSTLTNVREDVVVCSLTHCKMIVLTSRTPNSFHPPGTISARADLMTSDLKVSACLTELYSGCRSLIRVYNARTTPQVTMINQSRTHTSLTVSLSQTRLISQCP